MVTTTSKSSTNCLLCPEKFAAQTSLDFHTKTAHLGVYICTKCPRFTTLIKMRFIQHNRKIHNEFEMKAGDKRSAVKASLDKEPFEVSPKQAKVNQNDSTLSDEDNDRFQCGQCWFTSTTEDELNAHNTSKHTASNNQQETFCMLSSVSTTTRREESTTNSPSDSSDQSKVTPSESSNQIPLSSIKSELGKQTSKSNHTVAESSAETFADENTKEVAPKTDVQPSKSSTGIPKRERLTSRKTTEDSSGPMSVEKEAAETELEIRSMLSKFSAPKSKLQPGEKISSEIGNLVATISTNDQPEQVTKTIEGVTITAEDFTCTPLLNINTIKAVTIANEEFVNKSEQVTNNVVKVTKNEDKVTDTSVKGLICSVKIEIDTNDDAVTPSADFCEQFNTMETSETIVEESKIAEKPNGEHGTNLETVPAFVTSPEDEATIHCESNETTVIVSSSTEAVNSGTVVESIEAAAKCDNANTTPIEAVGCETAVECATATKVLNNAAVHEETEHSLVETEKEKVGKTASD